MQSIKIAILSLFVIFELQAQIHTPVLPNLMGDDLLDKLVEEFRPTNVLSYADARDEMYGTIYNENDSVSCVYSGHRLHLPAGVDPSTHLYMNGVSNGINCEHTYPRSKGAEGNAYSDMHHLFPTRTAVNASRGNFPFGEINDGATTTWFYLNRMQGGTPTTNINSYSEKIEGRFEPREVHKGNAARAVFYFYAMYENNALNADPDFFESQRAVLCDWHKQDPVDSLEWERTYMIGSYQNDLPNPFVLDSTLATRTFCQVASSVAELRETQISVYPNPVVDWLNITSKGQNQLKIVDALQRTLMEEQFDESLQLDFSAMKKGVYFIYVNGQVFKVLKP